MLDVLFPVLSVLREGGTGLPVRLKATAKAAAEETIQCGPFADGRRFWRAQHWSHGSGARSSALIVDAVADVMEGLA